MATTICKVAVADGKRIFIELPTGTGKTVINQLIAQMLRYLTKKRVFIVSSNPALSLWGH